MKVALARRAGLSTLSTLVIVVASSAGGLGACSSGSSSGPSGTNVGDAGTDDSKPADGGSIANDAGADARTSEPAGDGGEADLPPCTPTAPTACPTPAVTYTDVQPLLQARCVSQCHSGVPGGPWPLDEYGHAADWGGAIRSELLSCDMPPLDASVPMTNEEREKILTWVRCGTPR